MSQNIFSALFSGPEDTVTARKVVRIVVYISLSLALLAAVFAISGFFKESSNQSVQYLLDPWLLIDAFLTLVFTFYLYKHKLWAPICMIVHQVLGWVVLYIDLDKYPSGPAILILVIYISATRAVHMINKDTKLNDQQPT